jgi:hypothetical protein
MFHDRKDYVMRQIHQLTQFVARILALTQKGAWAEVGITLEQAYRDLLGIDKSLLDRVDVATLKMLLQSSAKTAVAVHLIEAEASAAEVHGDIACAKRLRSRARNLKGDLQIGSE